MRSRKSKEVNIFSASVVDLFASGLGVFLIVSIIALSKQNKSNSQSEEKVLNAVKKINAQYASKFKTEEEALEDIVKKIKKLNTTKPNKFAEELEREKLNTEIRKLKFELEKTQKVLSEVQTTLKEVDEKGRFELVKGKKSKLENVHFYPGSYRMIEPYASREIQKVAWRLKSRPQVKVEVSGHIYQSKSQIKRGRDTDYGKVSVKRAKAVCSKLIEFGVNKNQLTCKGYGAKRYLYLTNDSYSKEAQLNRRVEIEVLSE